MFKLLTKFKTQSLNEVKPYESNGSFVSVCGEIQNCGDNGVHDQSWPQDVCSSHPEAMDGGPKDHQFSCTPTCLVTRHANDAVKTLPLPAEVPVEEPGESEYENKENGDKRAGLSLNQNRKAGLSAEKRKWSDVRSARNSKQHGCGGGDSSSSDEEVKELLYKQQKSEHTALDKLGEGQKYRSARTGKIRPCDSHARKRHRLTSEDRIYRPSLDFEKMQQKVFWKRGSYTTSRPRIVKVRSFSGNPNNLLTDSSVTSFKPIQAIQAFKLTPVEEPRAFAY